MYIWLYICDKGSIRGNRKLIQCEYLSNICFKYLIDCKLPRWAYGVLCWIFLTSIQWFETKISKKRNNSMHRWVNFSQDLDTLSKWNEPNSIHSLHLHYLLHFPFYAVSLAEACSDHLVIMKNYHHNHDQNSPYMINQ